MLIAPVTIQCQNLVVYAERIIVEAPPGSREGAIALEAESAETSMLGSVPTANGNVTLSVSWPGAEAYPWTSFRTSPTVVQDPRTNEGLRRFRKFVISFRSHAKGALKRFAGKIEHERMTKGVGRAVLDHMIATGVVSTDGSMYTLDPDVLGQVTGASYLSTMAGKYGDRTIAFVAEAIGSEL